MLKNFSLLYFPSRTHVTLTKHNHAHDHDPHACDDPVHNHRHNHHDTHDHADHHHHHDALRLPPSGDLGKDTSIMSPVSRLYCILEAEPRMIRDNYIQEENISKRMLDWSSVSLNRHDISRYPGPLHPKQVALASFTQTTLPSYIHRLISGYSYLAISPELQHQAVSELKQGLSEFDVIGRVFVGEDGINVQISVPAKYASSVETVFRSISDSLFRDMRLFHNEFVDTRENPPAFSSLIVKKYPTLNLGLTSSAARALDETMEGYSHLDAASWHARLSQAIEQIESARARGVISSEVDLLPTRSRSSTGVSSEIIGLPLILDIRNEYEWEVGSFKSSLPIPVDAFRGTFSQLEKMLGLESLTPDVLELQKQRVLSSCASIKDPIRREQIIQETLKSFAQLSVFATNASLSETNCSMDIGNDEITCSIDTTSTETQTNDTASVYDAGIHKDRPIFLYCTGGIRCVSTGAFLSARGFSNVNVLEGGINSYLRHLHQVSVSEQLSTLVSATLHTKPEDTSLFVGANTVFDNRMTTPATRSVSSCQHCGTLSSRLVNCAHVECNSLVVSCLGCAEAYLHTCSVECAKTLYKVDVLGQVKEMLAKKTDQMERVAKTQKKEISLPLTPVLDMPKKVSVRSRIENIPARSL